MMRKPKWRQMLEAESDLSLRKFAANCTFEDSYVTKTLSLLRLVPDILHRALMGALPSAIKLNRLTEAAKYLSWEKQRQLIGLNEEKIPEKWPSAHLKKERKRHAGEYA